MFDFRVGAFIGLRERFLSGLLTFHTPCSQCLLPVVLALIFNKLITEASCTWLQDRPPALHTAP